MKLNRLRLITVLFFAFGLTGLKAQTASSTTEGDTSGCEGAVSDSTEQVVCQTHTGSSVSVAEQVQQPYEVSVMFTPI